MPIDKPLQGVRIVEFEGLGPAPLAAKYLQQMGASITLIARPTKIMALEKLAGDESDVLEQGKKRIALDIKSSPDDRAKALELIADADVLLEGLRPGVMERLGLGPDICAEANPRLVYARMTGWGQNGPLSHAAGHDLNYVALSGLVSISSRPGDLPIIPPTVVGDAAGALGMAFGIACAVFDTQRTGQGRIVDTAIVDVASMLGVLAQMLHAADNLGTGKPSSFHDSPFYDVYECACGGMVTVGAVEPQFYALLLDALGFKDVDPAAQYDTASWPELKERIRKTFLDRTRDEWCEIMEGTDICFAPVLTMDEAPHHPHNVARSIFENAGGGPFSARGAPRFMPLTRAAVSTEGDGGG